MEEIFQLVSFPFMQRALISCIILSVLLGLLGTFIVPRKMAFMADGISHASLLGIAIGLLLGVFPLALAIVIAIIMGAIVAALRNNPRITLDGLIGILLTAGMSGAIIIFALTPGYKPELFSYLFGSVVATTWVDVYVLCGLAAITLPLLKYFWRSLVLTTVHEQLSRVMNLPAHTANYFLFIFTAITLVTGVKILGIILVSGLLIIPVLSANLITNSLRKAVIVTISLAILGSIVGLILSFVFDLPSGPCIALTLIALLLGCLVVNPLLRTTRTST
tara:strand:+ start:102 stop:932 length:831 start_codon:yes stop_codon:yes gene_type:complete